MYATFSAYCSKKSIIRREWRKDKENKGENNGAEDRRQAISKQQEWKRQRGCHSGTFIGIPFLYHWSRNSVSVTINTLLPQCLSQHTLPFASVRLTVMESFGLMDASGVGFYLSLPLYFCLHLFTAEIPVRTFSIARERGDWGYDQCKCTIWHSGLDEQRAGRK